MKRVRLEIGILMVIMGSACTMGQETASYIPTALSGDEISNNDSTSPSGREIEMESFSQAEEWTEANGSETLEYPEELPELEDKEDPLDFIEFEDPEEIEEWEEILLQEEEETAETEEEESTQLEAESEIFEAAYAAEMQTLSDSGQETSGVCGPDLFWKAEEHVLLITGRGAMYDYSETGKPPWNSLNADILFIKVESGVTYIGEYAFCDLYVAEEILLPPTLLGIGGNAFVGCSSELIFSAQKTGSRTG